MEERNDLILEFCELSIYVYMDYNSIFYIPGKSIELKN